MNARIGNVVFYADDPTALSHFWADVLGYPRMSFEGPLREQLLASGLTEEDLATRGLAEDPEGKGPRLFFHHADGPHEGRNRIHLDVTVERQELESEKERLIGLGASVVRLIDQQWGPWPEHYYQMQDPEGNEFCLQA
jgi:catechol 2,3-dioxygenase-like lactoylglutathione lyase family enzyme